VNFNHNFKHNGGDRAGQDDLSNSPDRGDDDRDRFKPRVELDGDKYPKGATLRRCAPAAKHVLEGPEK